MKAEKKKELCDLLFKRGVFISESLYEDRIFLN